MDGPRVATILVLGMMDWESLPRRDDRNLYYALNCLSHPVEKIANHRNSTVPTRYHTVAIRRIGYSPKP